MNYNYFRDYEPGTGRYIESDPVGLNGGMNTYLYAAANPSRSADPLGLWVKLCIRGLEGRDSPPHKAYNPFSHWYLNVSGEILGIEPDGFSGWSQSRRNYNEDQNKGCTGICNDPKFDPYVIAAASTIGLPTYCPIAFPGTPIYQAGARNCQTWVFDVLVLAIKNYLAAEKCPECFKGFQ